MANKISIAAFALIMGFSFNSFAGTPETKGEAKPAENTSKTENVECYRNPDLTFHVKEGNGTCEPATGLYCSYIYTGSGEAGEDQDEANYTPVGSAGTRWQPQ